MGVETVIARVIIRENVTGSCVEGRNDRSKMDEPFLQEKCWFTRLPRLRLRLPSLSPSPRQLLPLSLQQISHSPLVLRPRVSLLVLGPLQRRQAQQERQ